MDENLGPFDIIWPVWIQMGLITLVLLLALVAFLSLRRRMMGEVPRFLWALFIFLVPVAGPIVFFIVHPEELPPGERKSV